MHRAIGVPHGEHSVAFALRVVANGSGTGVVPVHVADHKGLKQSMVERGVEPDVIIVFAALDLDPAQLILPGTGGCLVHLVKGA